MNIGISSYSYPWAVGVAGYPQKTSSLTPLQLLQRAVELGVNTVQFGDNLPLHRYTERELDELEAYRREHRLQIEVGTRGVELLPEYLQLAAKFGARIIRTLLPFGGVAAALPPLLALAPELEQKGVAIALENYELYGLEDYAALLNQLPSTCYGLCLDTANNLARGEIPEQYLDRLGGRVINFHAKEIGAKRLPSSMGFEICGMRLGEGIVSFPRLLKRLGPKVSVILEQWPPQLETLEATLEQESRWVREGVGYLRALAN